MELNIIKEEYLKKFRVFNPKTLSPPSSEEFVYWVSRNKCPLCQRKLYLNVNKTIARCKSKVKDKFIIRSNVLLSLGGSLR